MIQWPGHVLLDGACDTGGVHAVIAVGGAMATQRPVNVSVLLANPDDALHVQFSCCPVPSN